MEGVVHMMAELDILNGFASKIISDCLDIAIDVIRKADKNRKAKNQNIQTRIYQVLIDSLNYFTYNKYKKQDKLYDASESILKGFKSERNNADAVKSGLKMLVADVNNDICQDFLETLYREICRDDNDDLYKEIDVLWKRQESEYIQGEFEKSNQNHEKTHEKLDYAIEGINAISEKIDVVGRGGAKNYETPIENRAEEYAQKWDKNVFLNNFSRRDKKTGVNIKLRELYLNKHLPNYIWKTNDIEDVDCEESDIEQLLREYIIDNDDKKMLLILGQPGIGKSTLVTWIMANFIEKKNDIYVYQFASDLKHIDWQGDDILKNIFQTLNLNKDKLENNVLILDGFDEIHTNSDREKILNQIYHKLNGMNYLKHFSLIITCRKNYIHELQRVVCDYITLLAWDKEQISSFCENYGKVSKKVISQNTINNLISNREILGIPLILYMVLALDISVGEGNSLGDIYAKIFSLDGGIYDRCINNLSYGEEHRISGIKRQIHQISQRIAFWIFENNSEKAFITKEKYEEICNEIVDETGKDNEDIKRDVLISNYFKTIKHCEGIGTDELQFVHRSIYEYFVAETIFNSIKSSLLKFSSKNWEEFGKNIAPYMKRGDLRDTAIREYLKCKLDNIYNALEVERQHYFYQWWEETINGMMKCGMFLNSNNNIQNYIKEVSRCFINFMELLKIVLEIDKSSKREYICQYIERDILEKYIKYYFLEHDKEEIDYLKLEKMDLSQLDLGGVNFYYSNLEMVNLSHTNLKGAILYNTYLRGVDLTQTCMIGALLDIGRLNNVIFSVDQIVELEKYYNLQMGEIYISTKQGVIPYKDYYEQK